MFDLEEREPFQRTLGSHLVNVLMNFGLTY